MLRSSRRAALVCAIALAACGGSHGFQAEPNTFVSGASIGTPVRAVAGVAVLPALLAPPGRVPYVGRSWILPDAKTSQLLYVSLAATNVVNIYDLQGVLMGQITGLSAPDGMAVDLKGRLYVTNYHGASVSVFPKGSTKSILTLSDPGTNPVDVVVTNGGTVYVSNTTIAKHMGFISVYLPGHTKASRKLRDIANRAEGLGITLDASGNVYWTILARHGHGGGTVDEFVNGTGNPVGTGISLRSPGGIKFDSNKNMVVCDVLAPAIDVFPPGSTIPALQYAKTGYPLFHAFNRAETEDFVADFGNGDVGVYAYPSGTLMTVITAGGLSVTNPPQGVAVDPRAAY